MVLEANLNSKGKKPMSSISTALISLSVVLNFSGWSISDETACPRASAGTAGKEVSAEADPTVVVEVIARLAPLCHI